MEKKSAEELSASLEHAAAIAKLLPTTTDPSHHQKIYDSLTAAHHNLSSFLLSIPCYQNPPPPPPLDENSDDESAVNGEPMQLGDEVPTMMDEVEEKMRDLLFIRNKRPKRAISPSSAAEAERRRLYEEEEEEEEEEKFDPNTTRLKNLELIYQFHC